MNHLRNLDFKKLISKRLAKPDKTIRVHTFELLLSARTLFKYGYISNSRYSLLRKACKFHDYGKINDEFQSRIISKKKFDPNNELPHNVLSLFFIPRKEFKTEEDYLKTCYAVLNHHQNINNFNVLLNNDDLTKKFIKKFELNNIKKKTVALISEYRENLETQLLKGFLHKCDYSASGNFKIEYPNNFLKDSMENLNYNWNPLQKFCIENTDKNIFVVANTGMGKTEAGLLWIGDNKGFFILPLKTAINAIFSRISKNIIKENIEERLALMHSDVLSYYLNNAVTEEDKVLEYLAKGKNLSMPLTISTLDQIFDFIYLYDGFEIKLATLSYSKIVIDEIQAYSPYLLAYLIVGLKKITDAGGKFAILTATFPPFVKNLIEKEVGEIKSVKFTEGSDRHFIKILEERLNPEKIYQHYNENLGKTLVVCNTVKKSQEIYSKLLLLGIPKNEINLFHGKFIKKDRTIKEHKILEFGKTENEGRGIWISTSLVEASLDIDFDYLFTELNDLNGFFQRLGRVNRKGAKSYNIFENKRQIKLSDSPNLAFPNVYLFTEIEKNLLLSANSKSGFIDETIYFLSKEALLTVKGILSENKKNELIENYLTTENILNSNFLKKYKEMNNYISTMSVGAITKDETKKIFRDILSYNVIPMTIYEENLDYILELKEIITSKFEKNDFLSFEENLKLKNENRLKKSKAQYELDQFTVSVGIYDLNKTGITLDLGFNKIEVINSIYSSEEGFIRVSKNNDTKQEEIDNFF